MLFAALLVAMSLAGTPGPQLGPPPRQPPSTMSDPIYVVVPVTIEITNMTPQVVADLVASGKIAIDGANHLNIPPSLAPTRLGPDMLRPGARGAEIPANSPERPLRIPPDRVLSIAAPAKFMLVTPRKVQLKAQGSRIVLTEIK